MKALAVVALVLAVASFMLGVQLVYTLDRLVARVDLLEWYVGELEWAAITRNYVRDARWAKEHDALLAKVNWYIIRRSGLPELERVDAALEDRQ